jgi:hypothetical protein
MQATGLGPVTVTKTTAFSLHPAQKTSMCFSMFSQHLFWIVLLQVLSPLMRVSPAYGEVVMGVFALIAYQVLFHQHFFSADTRCCWRMQALDSCSYVRHLRAYSEACSASTVSFPPTGPRLDIACRLAVAVSA